MDHDRQIERAEGGHELVVTFAAHCGRYGSEISIDGEAGQFRVTACLGDDRAQIPGLIGAPYLENRVRYAFARADQCAITCASASAMSGK
jgi:hypothetical protein